MVFTEILYFKKYTNLFIRITDKRGCLPENLSSSFPIA